LIGDNNHMFGVANPIHRTLCLIDGLAKSNNHGHSGWTGKTTPLQRTREDKKVIMKNVSLLDESMA